MTELPTEPVPTITGDYFRSILNTLMQKLDDAILVEAYERVMGVAPGMLPTEAVPLAIMAASSHLQCVLDSEGYKSSDIPNVGLLAAVYTDVILRAELP